MKILVTGATGFIGTEIIKELIAANDEIVGISRNAENKNSGNPQIIFQTADISDYQTLEKLETLENVTAIIHSAGLAHQFGDTKKEEFDSVNVKGSENIVKLGINLKIEHFILIGSTAVYGFENTEQDGKKLIYREDSVVAPQTAYAESKLQSEKVCQHLCEKNQIPLTIFRLAPVIGENNVGNVERLIKSIDRNQFLWIGKGENYKSLIYKNDVAKACVLLLKEKKGQTEIFNLAAEPIKMREFVEQIAKLLNKRIIPIKIPTSFVRSAFRVNEKIFKVSKLKKLAQTIEKWLADDVYSNEKIFNSYKFHTQTPILEAITKQVEFYKKLRQ